jgi:hypothetical protein
VTAADVELDPISLLPHRFAMVELPTELWLRIAYFVADVDLYRLTLVNRLFFDLAMDRRYKQLIIDHDRPLALINKLSRLE